MKADQKRQSERSCFVAFTMGKQYDSELFTKAVISLSEVVVSRHFAQSLVSREDLIAVGVEKAIRSLRASHFNPQSNIRGYLYTGIRNEVGNYLKREQRRGGLPVSFRRILCTASHENFVVLKMDIERQFEKVQQRFQSCGVKDDRYEKLSWRTAL